MPLNKFERMLSDKVKAGLRAISQSLLPAVLTPEEVEEYKRIRDKGRGKPLLDQLKMVRDEVFRPRLLPDYVPKQWAYWNRESDIPECWFWQYGPEPFEVFHVQDAPAHGSYRPIPMEYRPGKWYWVHTPEAVLTKEYPNRFNTAVFHSDYLIIRDTNAADPS